MRADIKAKPPTPQCCINKFCQAVPAVDPGQCPVIDALQAEFHRYVDAAPLGGFHEATMRALETRMQPHRQKLEALDARMERMLPNFEQTPEMRDAINRTPRDIAIMRGFIDVAGEFEPAVPGVSSMARFLRDRG